MIAFITSVQHMHGIGKASGKPYNITKLYGGIESALKLDNGTRAGLETFEAMGVEGLTQIAQKLPLPCWCELTTDAQINFGKAETVVVQISVAQKSQPAKSN